MTQVTPTNSANLADDFEWTATCYLLGDLSLVEQVWFEEQLAADQSARDRFLEVINIIQAASSPSLAGATPFDTSLPVSSTSQRSWVYSQAIPLGLVASLMVAFTVGSTLFWSNQHHQPGAGLTKAEPEGSTHRVNSIQVIRDWNSIATNSEAETELWLADPLADSFDEFDNAFQPPEWLLAVAELDAAQPATGSIFPADSDQPESN